MTPKPIALIEIEAVGRFAAALNPDFSVSWSDLSGKNGEWVDILKKYESMVDIPPYASLLNGGVLGFILREMSGIMGGKTLRIKVIDNVPETKIPANARV